MRDNKPSSLVQKTPKINISYRLKKIYLLEKMKNRYLSSNNFKSYKKACLLEERILEEIRSPEVKATLSEHRNPITQALVQKISRQMVINQTLLDEIKVATVDVWGVVSGYYSPEGEINKKSLKLFSTNA